MAQLEAVKAGDFTDADLTSARQAVVSRYRGTLDSRAQLEYYWLSAAVTGRDETPEALIARLEQVTAQDVVAVARGLELDTIYRLMGKEG